MYETTLNTPPTCSPTVLCKKVEDGAVLFCSRTEIYFGLNAVGLLLWNALAREYSSFDELIDAFQERFPDQPRDALAGDLREFLDALEENELVFSNASGAGAAGD